MKTYLPVFPGFYGTGYDITESIDEYTIWNSPSLVSTGIKEYIMHDSLCCGGIDHTKCCEDVSKYCVNCINTELEKLGYECTFTFESLHSPKEYNFRNDSINVDCTFTCECWEKIVSYCKKHSKEFSEYLLKYKSCSGFISYYSHHVEDWFQDMDNIYVCSGSIHKLGSILEFVLRNNNPDINDSMREGVCEDVYAELNESFICDSVNSEFGTEFESLEDMEVYC